MSRAVRLAVLIVALVAGVAVVGFSRLDGDWLRGKIVEIGRDKLGADIRIRSLKFSALRGEAELAGVEVDRETADSVVHARLEAVRVKVRLLPLLARKVRIERLEADRPDISWTVLASPGLNQVPGGLGDKLWRKASGPVAPVATNIDFTVDELVLRDGKVEINWLGNGPPFTARAARVAYDARNVSFDNFVSLVSGADISADIDLGGKTALLRKQRAPATVPNFFLSDINLAYVDRLFDQTDALVVTGGTLNLHYVDRGDNKVDVQAVVLGLELGENPSARQTIAFVPIGLVRDAVTKRQGNFDLSFSLDERKLAASRDLRSLVQTVWAGMQASLLKSAAAEVLKGAR